MLDVGGLVESHDDMGRPQWLLPPLERLAAREPSWLGTLDSLRPPRPADSTVAEWRRTAPVRPVVFADTGRLTSDVVRLHLDQRVAQRLLARFAAQGFTHEDLSRACLVQTEDPLPRVILLGRLALYGQGAERLHEEVVSVTARWRHPNLRRGEALVPYGREGEARTLAILATVLRHPDARSPSGPVRDDCLGSAADDIAHLLPYLQDRANEAAAAAVELLSRRGVAEANALRTTLERQRAHVQAEVDRDRAGARQLPLGFTPKDAANLEADRRHWATRLAQFQEDITVAPARYEAFYAVKARRVEPIGLVFLVPARGA